MEDQTLPRLVALGLIVLTALVIGAGALLKYQGLDASELITLGATGMGALAGFLSRDRLQGASE